MDSATHAIEIAELEKRYGDTRAVDGVTLSVAGRRGVRAPRPERRGQDHHRRDPRGLPPRRRRRGEGAGPRPLDRRRAAPAADRRDAAGAVGSTPGLRPLEALRLFASYYDDPDDPERLLHLVGLATRRARWSAACRAARQQRLSLALSLVGRPVAGVPRRADRGHGPARRATTWDARSASCATRGDDRRAHHPRDGRSRAALRPRRRSSTTAGSSRAARPTELMTTPAAPRPRSPPRRARRRRARGRARTDRRTVRERGRASTSSTCHATPALVAALAAWLRDTGTCSLSELRAGRRSLEDVFLRLTGRDAR